MIALVFPGQGSQKPGMGQDLAENSPAASRIFNEVSSATGLDLRTLCWNSDEETLRSTQNAQLALFTCGVAAWSALEAAVGVRWSAVAGHSVGEYAALAAAGVFAVDDAARLVQIRGDLMADAGKTAPGTMAAVLGLEAERLQEVCASVQGVVVIANDNCPGQLVISGEVEAVAEASKLASEAGAKRVLPLNVSGAFHSPLMAGPAKQMGVQVRGVNALEARVKVFANVTAAPVIDSYEWPGLLERQLESRVRWTETIQNMIAEGVDTFVECGGGDVLSGLIRRIDKSVTTLKVADMESLDATVQALAVL